MLNGDILEYHAGEVTAVEENIAGGIDPAAIELLIEFVNFVWANYHYNNLRLSGGGWKENLTQYVTTTVYNAIGPTGVENLMYMYSPSRYKDSKRKIVRAKRRKELLDIEEKYPRWKKIGEEKRQQRILRRMEDKFPQKYDFEFMDEQGVKESNERITQNVIDISNQMAPNVDGKKMLSWKNSLTRMLRTHMTYRMSAVKVTQKVTKYKATTPWWEDSSICNHSTLEGNGPGLYTAFQDTTKVTGSLAGSDLSRDLSLWEPNAQDYGKFVSYDEWKAATDTTRLLFRAIGSISPVYFMNVDWIGTYMSPFSLDEYIKFKNDTDAAPATEAEIVKDPLPSWVASQMGGYFLKWKYVPYSTTTDRNTPVQADTIINTKDWTYLTHYYTKYNFKFRNFSRRKYCVEILCFKFKADIDTFNYQRICLITTNRQNDKMQDYIDGSGAKPEDINILWKKRIYIEGLNQVGGETTTTVTNADGTNTKNWKYIHKRKYVIKRPVLNSYQTLDERSIYLDYYEHERAPYFRIQGWPVCPNVDLVTGTTQGIILNPHEDTLCQPGATADSGTVVSPCVDVVIDKKSYFKLDEPLYKNYTPS